MEVCISTTSVCLPIAIYFNMDNSLQSHLPPTPNSPLHSIHPGRDDAEGTTRHTEIITIRGQRSITCQSTPSSGVHIVEISMVRIRHMRRGT
jgi:hypothetical protein